MSSIVDDPSSFIAARLRSERDHRSWSLADLSTRSGVSKGMLSKIEREEVSPTATVLSRVATAFGLTLAEFVARPSAQTVRLLRAKDQPLWRDPKSAYTRRQVFLSPASPLELVEIELPSGESASFPSSAYELVRQAAWVLRGKLTILEGSERHDLGPGDRLEFGPPTDVTFRNDAGTPCRYLIALVRR